MLTTIILSILICALQAQTEVIQKDITFRLYTENNPVDYIICDPADLTNCNINVALECKFLVHGYLGSADADWVIAGKNEYLQKGPYNVFTVDWSKLAKKTYDKSSADTKTVGEFIGYFISQLHNIKGVAYAIIHIIGHSLGAHAGGFAGKYIISTDGQKCNRITGLDPANPNFTGKPPSERLYKDDANITDIIHTDQFVLGDPDTDMGQINFYPNGGVRLQPGCSSKRKRQTDIKPSFISCSHTRSANFFTESIISYRFIATQCDNYANYQNGLCANNPTTPMGENFNTSLTGQFYLKTNSESPYAQG